MPSLEERRLLERRKLQGLFTVYREALGNGHSFLGSDGQEHAIKLVDRSNRRAFARTETNTFLVGRRGFPCSRRAPFLLSRPALGQRRHLSPHPLAHVL